MFKVTELRISQVEVDSKSNIVSLTASGSKPVMRQLPSRPPFWHLGEPCEKVLLPNDFVRWVKMYLGYHR